MTIDAKTVRAAIDAALREVSVEGTKQKYPDTHPWSSPRGDCAAHGEGLNCCIDPEHTDYGRMLDDLAARVAGRLDSTEGVKHDGLHTYRFADNPEEKRFAREWSRQNASERGAGTLAYLLGDGAKPLRPTVREAQVAATVVQWLGSPVGLSWLEELGFEKKR